MQLQSTFTLPVGLEEAWVVVDDVPRLVRCLPNVTITRLSGDRCDGALAVSVGLLSVTLQGSAEVVGRDVRMRSVLLHAAGGHSGLSSTADIHVQLLRRGDETIVVIVTELAATGPLARVGHLPLSLTHDRYWQRFGQSLATELRPAAPAAPAAPRPSSGLGTARPSLRSAVRRATDTARSARGVALQLRG